MRLTKAFCDTHYLAHIITAKSKLKTIWCVPSAVSYMMNTSYEEAESRLKPFLTHKRVVKKITYVFRSEWEAFFQVALPHARLFYCRTKDKTHKSYTLGKFYSAIRRGAFAIQTTKHMLLLIDGEIYDNQRGGELPYAKKGYWKCRICSIWLLA